MISKCSIQIMILMLSTAFLFSCASYSATRQPDMSFDQHCLDNKTEENGIELMVKPIISKSDEDKYFGTEMLKQGILPVQILIQNKSEEIYYFSTDGIVLLDELKNTHTLLPVDSVIKKCKKSYWRTAGWTVAFGVFGLIPSAINVNNTNEKMESDYHDKSLKSGNLFGGGVKQGIIFFDVPPSTQDIQNWRIKVSFKEIKKDQLIFIESKRM